MNAI
jgi:hypothetical protein